VKGTARRRRRQEATTMPPGRRYMPENDNVDYSE